MSLNKGVLAPTRDGELFVGWTRAPAADRRFVLASFPLALIGASGLGYGLASGLEDPGRGRWETGATHRVTGVLAMKPYPMLFTADEMSPFGVRTILLVAQGKCTSALDLAAVEGRSFTAAGALIIRGTRTMLEVPLTLEDWIEPSNVGVKLPPLLPEPLGRARLKGQIMDTKCFFGVMRPGRGKAHKACAALCIRGGIPPSFWARGKDGREAVLLMTDPEGGPLGADILPLVAELVEAEGELVRVGDLIQFRADARAYRLA
jgi:hypothetical protein